MDLQEAALLHSLLLLDRRHDTPALKTVAGRTGGEYRFLKEERTLRACPGNTTVLHLGASFRTPNPPRETMSF